MFLKQEIQLELEGPFTFVHAVKDLVQVAFSIATLMLLPHRAILAPQNHQFAVPTAMRGEMGDLHDHGAKVEHSKRWEGV